MSTLPITQALRAAAMALCLCLCTSAQAATLSYIGQQIVPTGTLFAGTTVGGLSGLDRDPLSGAYFVVSDDRSSVNPARFYGLNLDLSLFVRAAAPGSAGVQFQSVTTLLKPDGLPFAANTLDPESVRINPANGRLVWTNEGQRGGAGVPALQAPTVREAALDGSYVRDFAVPVSFAPLGSVGGNVAGDSGIRNNLAFESLSFSTDGRTLYTATENALVQDGPAAGVGAGSPSRILSFDVATGQAGAQWIYPVEPVALAPNPPGGFATNGLVELLAFGERQFIAVERSFAAGAATPGVGPGGQPTGNTIRLYLVDARSATDVSGFSLSSGLPYSAVSKTLLLDLSDLRNDDGSVLALDNIEGITWGPEVDGKPTLILVSDNNFSPAQFTQFVALSVSTPIPEPTTWSLWAVGLAWVMRRGCRKAQSTTPSM